MTGLLAPVGQNDPAGRSSSCPMRASHAVLARSDLRMRLAPVSPGQVDAVIVPASRGAAALDGAANLAADLGATLVALCSRQARASEVIERVARASVGRVVATDVPSGYRHELMPTRAVAQRFRAASANRSSDLSVKRNVGLLLARLNGWGKVFFLDDDIGVRTLGRPTGLSDRAVRRMTTALDRYQIAGLTCRDFPDNSVLCHARRLAGFRQDVFVSGAAVGVNCHDHPLPFFPDQYNEDWFFFSRRVAERDIGHAGDAVQARYDPFATPERARQEEFGDLLAEGLFALFQAQPPGMAYRRRLDAADIGYWERFMADRRASIDETSFDLELACARPSGDTPRLSAAWRSLDAAADQLSRLTPELCVDYLEAWAEDLVEWEQAVARVRMVGSVPESLDFLGLRAPNVSGARRPVSTTVA